MNIYEARGVAARCWCDPRVSNRVMDPDLAEVFAEQLSMATSEPSPIGTATCAAIQDAVARAVADVLGRKR